MVESGWIVPLQGEKMANRRIVISVIEPEGEKLFESDGVRFDMLYADQMWKDGKRTIMRDGAVFDQTSYIDEYGTHAACTCFCGLKKIANSNPAVNGVQPCHFNIGDELILEFPARPDNEIGFVDHLRESACAISAIYGTLRNDRNQKMTLEELRTRTQERTKKNASHSKQSPIIRFTKCDQNT